MNSILHIFPNPQIMLVNHNIYDARGYIFNISDNGKSCNRILLTGKTLCPSEIIEGKEENENVLFIAERNGYTKTVKADMLEKICDYVYDHFCDYGKVLEFFKESDFIVFKKGNDYRLKSEGDLVVLTIDGHKAWFHAKDGLEITDITDLLAVVDFIDVTLDCIRVSDNDKFAAVLKNMLYNIIHEKSELKEFHDGDRDEYWMNDGKLSYKNKDFENPIPETTKEFCSR